MNKPLTLQRADALRVEKNGKASSSLGVLRAEADRVLGMFPEVNDAMARQLIEHLEKKYVDGKNGR